MTFKYNDSQSLPAI